MKKILLTAIFAGFAFSANANEKYVKPIIPPGEREAADPELYYPQAYRDNEYGEAAPAPRRTLVKDLPPEPSEVFDTDKKGNIVIIDP